MKFSKDDFASKLIFIVSLLLIYEVELRSIGHGDPLVDPVNAINLISSVWLSDLGLFLPIIFATFSSNNKFIYYKNETLVFICFLFIYGIFMFFIQGNQLYMLGQDLRVCFAIFTGLCLGALLPNSPKTLATHITILSASAVFIATIILFAMPGASFLTLFIRTTHPRAFIILGISIVLFSPAMILSILLRNRKLIALSWLSSILFLIISILILQTRSLTITVILGIISAFITTMSLISFFKRNRNIRKLLKITKKVILIFMIFAAGVLYWRQDNLKPFLLRMEGLYSIHEDPGIEVRFKELPEFFGSMTTFDHLFGKGLNPSTILTDPQGTRYNTLHFGVLNIWWRFGFPVFIMVIILFSILFIKWLLNLKNLFFRSFSSEAPRGEPQDIFAESSEAKNAIPHCGKPQGFLAKEDEITNKTTALIVCAPGVITLFAVSCMSGGWGISTMIPLGILWGVYRKIYYSDSDLEWS